MPKIAGINKNTIFTSEVFRVIVVIFTAALYSLAVEIFLEPIKLVSIGLTSIGQILGLVVSNINPNAPMMFRSPGIYVMIFNIPLLIYGYKTVSKRFIIYTILSIVVQTIFMFGFINGEEVLAHFGITTLDNHGTRLFLAIIAGLLTGVAIGIALRFGTSTGGVDILAQVINLKKGYAIGIFEMIINVALAVVNGFIIKDATATLFTFIFIIINSLVVDKIHTAYNYLRIDVITKHKEEVAKALIDGVQRGCTILDVQGAYTHESKFDVFMVISSYELEKAKQIIYEVDGQAFIMVTPIKRIIGAFFKHTIA